MQKVKTDADPAAGTDSKAACPMQAMCRGMIEKRSGTGLLLMIPGLALVGVGALILIEPEVLVWLMACTSILLGLLLIVAVSKLRGFAARMAGTKEQV